MRAAASAAACGSSLFWDAPGRATISIAAGSLDEPTGLEVIGHVYVEQAGDYYALPDDGVPLHARLQDSRRHSRRESRAERPLRRVIALRSSQSTSSL